MGVSCMYLTASLTLLQLQKEPKFVYSVDMDVQKLIDLEPRTWEFISELEPKVGLIEHLPHDRTSGDIMSIVHDCRKLGENATTSERGDTNLCNGSHMYPNYRKPKVAVVGSGPAGLFASLVLAEFGADVTLMERGQAVEKRGRDIGALVVRRILQEESNFCFGEVISRFTYFLQRFFQLLEINFCNLPLYILFNYLHGILPAIYKKNYFQICLFVYWNTQIDKY